MREEFAAVRELFRDWARRIPAGPTLDEVHMNRFKAIGSAFFLVPALALIATQAHAEFKCDAPGAHVDRVACEKAKEGPQALRRYIERIRVIESLEFSDYVSEAQARAWLQADSDRAAAKKAPVQTVIGLPQYTGA